jgi:hypothetical protein
MLAGSHRALGGAGRCPCGGAGVAWEIGTGDADGGPGAGIPDRGTPAGAGALAGRAWLAVLPDELAAQRRVMTALADRCEAWRLAASLLVGCSLGQGDALANVRLASMAYDTALADRIRFLIGSRPGVTEKKMFGGLTFLVGGNMAISASGQGGALVRADPAETDALVATANATLAVMGGRTMQGWLRVSSEDMETDEQLTEWVNRAVGYARSLPPKR